MKSNQSSFLEHYLLIKVEGFKQQELISECIKKRIPLRNIKIISNIEMTLKIKENDFASLKKLAKNKYRISVVSEGGYIPLLGVILNNKAKVCGILLFLFIIYFQTLFISEVQIEGYEKFTEKEVRAYLREGGLYEGCDRRIDLDKLRLFMYDKLDNVSFVGISTQGCLASVRIVEGTINLEKVDKSKPCDIVASREGYVYRVIPIEGLRIADTGTFVNKGDILIAGTIPLKSTAYGQPESNITQRFVHAEGKAYARIPYRFLYNQSLYKIEKKNTGKFFYTVSLKLGEKSISTADLYSPYEVSVSEEVKKLEGVRPFPYSFSVEKVSQVELQSIKRSKNDIEKEVNKLVRKDIKEKLPKNAQILNKSLYFGQEKNIIEVAVMLEALQEIGVEQEIVIGEQVNRSENIVGQ